LTKEEGTVTRTDAANAWITIRKTSACASCSSRNKCVSLGEGNMMEVEAINNAGARVGDRVVIRIETSGLLKISAFIYLFPILCLVAGAIIGHSIATSLSVDESLWTLGIGFLLFFLAFLPVRVIGNRMAKKPQFKPRIIRIVKRTES